MKLTLRQITNKQTKQKKYIGKKDSNEKLFASNFNFSASIILYLDSLLSGHLTESFNIRKWAIKALKHGLELHLLLLCIWNVPYKIPIITIKLTDFFIIIIIYEDIFTCYT